MQNERKKGTLPEPEFTDENLAKIDSHVLPNIEKFDAQDAVGSMINSIPAVKSKNLQESIALGKRIENGRRNDGTLNQDAMAARDELAFSCVKINFKIARKYSSPRNPVEDLFQEGMIGLLRAAEKYDWRKGFQFVTYGAGGSYLAIKAAIMRREKSKNVYTFTDKTSPEDYMNDEIDTFAEQIIDKDAINGRDLEDFVDVSILKDLLNQALEDLTDKQMDVIRLRYSGGLNQREITEKLGGGGSRAMSDREARAIRKLRMRLEQFTPFVSRVEFPKKHK